MTTRPTAGGSLMSMIAGHWPAVVVAIIGGIIGGVMAGAIVAELNSITAHPSPRALTGFGVFSGLLVLSMFVSRQATVRLSEDITLSLRLRLVRAVLAIPLRKAEERGVGELLAVIINDGSALHAAISAMTGFIVQAIMLLSILGYIAWISWRLLLLTMGALALTAIIMEALRRPSEAIFTRHRQAYSHMMTQLTNVIRGIKELKLDGGLREDLIADIDASGRHQKKLFLVAEAIFYPVIPATRVILYGVMIFALLYGGHLWGLTTDDTRSYVLAMMAVLGPGDSLAALSESISRGRAAQHNMAQLGIKLAEEAAARESALKPPEKPKLNTCIVFEEVTSRFQSETSSSEFTLGPIELMLSPGQITFIVGGNGSGKTTFAKVIAGLYEPETGTITLDGTEIDNTNIAWYRSHFSAIFSDYQLFDSLKGLAVDDIDDRANEYLKLLKLENKVTLENGTLSTVTALSAGQRKRLALLMLLLQDRPICILDEWASDQDPHYKAFFYTELLPSLKAKGKALVVISHDDHYFKVADEIVKLENGQMVSDATGQFMHRLHGFSKLPEA